MRLNKTLLVAAALVGASTATSKAYDLYGASWNYSQPSFSYGSYFVGDDWYGREYNNLTAPRYTNIPGFGSRVNATETDLVNAGVYRGVAGSFSWSGNDYNNYGNTAAYVRGELQTGPADVSFNAQGFFDWQEGYYENGTFNFDSRDTTTNLAIGHNSYGIYMDTDGNWYGSWVSGTATVYERDVQVARTGSGFNGANARSAFASDNSDTPDAAFYDETIVGRNVLPTITIAAPGGGAGGASFVNGSFENTSTTADNMTDVDFNAAMTGVVATARSTGTLPGGEVDIQQDGVSGYFGLATQGTRYISLSTRNDRVALALTSSLVQGQVYSLSFDYNFFNHWGLTPDSALYVYAATGAATFDTLIHTIAANGPGDQWLNASFTFTAGANINYIAVAGDATANAWVAIDNFSFGSAPAATEVTGSVVREADIALGFSGSEGLYAKDGGWLDIRGDLTLGAAGTIYIRDGEITSNVYTQSYTPGTLDIVGRLAIESGILSVRSRFAQDMSATWGQTLGFRDGAVNASRLILEGAGYGFDGEGGAFGPEGSSFGALRSITGDNVQNGNISIVADGEGFFPGGGNGAVIGTDLGSRLTINGTINGLNSGASQGGAFLGYFSEGDTIQNGRILSGVAGVLKAGRGELLLTASNLFSGDLQVQEGSVRVTNSGALSGTSGQTLVNGGASLILDHATGLSLVDDIRISGTGHAEGVGALHNKSGANATTGNLWVDSNDVAESSATVTVAASSSLTVANLRGASEVNSLAVDVGGSGPTAGAFTVLGNTGALDNFYKNGTGNATLTALSAALDDIDVNAGNLLVLGSEDSSSANVYSQLDIDGAQGIDGKPLGTLELRGNHHYGEFNIAAVDTLITGSVTHHGNGGYDLDITGNATVTVAAGATLTTEQNDDEDASADIEDASKLVIKGTFQANGGSIIDLDDEATLDIRAGGVATSDVIANNDSSVVIASADGEGLGAGVLNGDIRAYDSAAITLGGVVNGDILAYGAATVAISAADGEGLGAGVLNGDVTAYDSAAITLGGVINGDVETYGDATLTLLAGAVHNGDYTAYGDAVIVINGTIDNDEGNPLGQNFSISGSALLKGSGTIGGNLTQTGGRVAPGNSTDVLSVLGNYSISAGSLQIEIGGNDGPGSDPTGNDQIAVAGTITVGGTAVLDFQPYNGFESARRGVYQVLATGAGAARATIGTFDTVDLTGLSNRVLFDHSSGKAYGTGLSRGGLGQTFAAYGAGNANHADIGRALWMESVAKDNSGLNDNYGTGAIDPAEALANSGQKVFILTRDASGVDATQVRTDLGAAAVSVLTAADVGAALDALSPEAYVGITELGVRVTRNFAQLPASKRKLAPANEWDFSVGYAGEQITASSGATAFTNYKVSSDQINLTAAKDLSNNLRLTLAAGLDDGKVGAAGFSADTDTQAFGLGLGFTPDSKGWKADLGLALTRTDWTAARGVAQTGSDNEDGLGVALRVSLAPAVDGALSYAPYVGLSYASQDQSSVAEVGSDNDGMVGVGFAGYERKSLVSELGLKAEYALKPGTTLTGVVAWEHEFKDGGETTLDAEFTEDGVTDTRFAVTSAGFGQDIFRVGVGVRVELGAKSAFSLGYDALLSSDSKSGQGIKADVAFRF